MKKVTMIIAFLFFMILTVAGCDAGPNVKDLITKQFKNNSELTVAKSVLVSVSDAHTGISQKRTTSRVFDNTLYKNTEVYLPYEATIKYYCVNKSNNKRGETKTENIRGDISQDKMGRYQISGVPSVNSLCDNSGCQKGNCKDGLGAFLYSTDDGVDKEDHLFIGIMKEDGKGKFDLIKGFDTIFKGTTRDIRLYGDSDFITNNIKNSSKSEALDFVDYLINSKFFTKEECFEKIRKLW